MIHGVLVAYRTRESFVISLPLVVVVVVVFNVGVRSRNGIYDGQSGTAWLEPEAIYVQEAPPAQENA